MQCTGLPDFGLLKTNNQTKGDFVKHLINRLNCLFALLFSLLQYKQLG